MPAEFYLARTRAWTEQFVVGLRLCPFALPVLDAQRVRFAFSEARDERTLYLHFLREIQLLLDHSAENIETTLLVHPFVLLDFLDYNDFLATLDDAIRVADLEGVIQVASFHPEYLFGGEDLHDASHFTNRSPYPMVHLLREASVEAALTNYPESRRIPERNIVTMRAVGVAKLRTMLAEL